MKKIFCALLLSVAVLPVFAQGTGALPPPIPKAASYNLQGMPLSQVVAMVYGQVLKEPYLLDDVVKATPVTVSLKEADPETVRAVLDAYLATKGVTRVQRSGVNLFVPAGKVAGDPVSGAPLPDGVPGLADPLPPVPGGGAGPIAEGLFAAKPSLPPVASMYRAKNRPVAELAKVFTAVIGPGGVVQDNGDNGLLLFGDPVRVNLVRSMLEQYDRPTDEVVAKVTVVEYSSTDDDGAGLFGAIRALGGKLGVSLGDAMPFQNVISFKNNTIEAVLSLISQDSRFSVLDTSTLRIVSGKEGQLNVGQDVPVLGQFQLDSKGNAVQSVSYRSSGLLVQVKPVVLQDKVFTDLKQEVSSFAVTKTSNIDSPTLNKRQFNTTFSAQFGEVVLLGGLDESKASDANSGLFGFRLSKTMSRSKTTLFLVLQFNKA
ncbi:Type II secretion system protein D [Cupriavidus metallidurans]|jgi:general secretion pathway protein D|uniref:type II secretion system protein GspD n=1 Tax=Cupriavidus metallidurans TaxID=119219 RepID=UPI0007639395|nr:hypothetical protein [Cupriavidus metallidurans]KWW38200.1 Type II secretion system protein D [Cupriavidus metallidurans]